MGQAFPHLLGLFLLMMLPLYGQLQVLTVEPDWSTFFTGESVKLMCDMREGKDADWIYAIRKDGQELYPFSRLKTHMVQLQTTNQGGKYFCIGFNIQRGSTKSNVVSLTVSDRNLILQHPAAILYRGETVPLRCRHRLQTDMTTATFYKNRSLIVTDPNQRTLMMSENAAEIGIQLQSDSSYTCKLGTGDESQPIRVKVDPYRPKAELRKDEAAAGGKVTLTCSTIIPSHGWKFFWYRGKKKDSLTAQDVAFLSNDRISTSQGGVYWCRGGRGNPVYYTEYSNPIVTSAAAVTLQPSWPEIYYGEALTLWCQIEGGEDFEWIYKWAVPNANAIDIQSKNEYRINYATGSHNGNYMCLGQMKNETSSTARSPAFNLRVSNNKLKPNLTVSPSWLSSGDSVTLNCRVKYPDVGWRFYWYKAIPNLPTMLYTMEPLPGSSNGTEQPYFIVYGQTQTAGYVCRAARGNPQSFTYNSEVKFVWSGDVQSAATLSVSPDRAQHFITDTMSLSLTCAGDSAEWTVNRFSSSSGYLTHCATWGSMTGPTCYINGQSFIDGVYWCETTTGLFSNAVNITGTHNNAIVDFPVHPVTEGQPVTLRCKWKTELNLAVISFYKNDKLIQNDTRGEFFIPAVSKSDEGFYKCGRKGRMQRSAGSTSPASWMSIKAAVLSQQHPSSPVGIVSFMRIILVCVLTVAAGIAVCVLHRRPQQGERGELRQEPELCESGS
ncbi:Fc receptor-like protein 5 [Takifugu rubripes]|uniref:Fc receptor-like protein 5 n=1 Tax=Takifugu rubripes TaxID=31033 RepID=UPI0011456DB6|nr:Fc receptor-like protein 5 [Takifugu rubripes]